MAAEEEVFLEEVKLGDGFITTQSIGSRNLTDYPVFPFEGTEVLFLSF